MQRAAFVTTAAALISTVSAQGHQLVIIGEHGVTLAPPETIVPAPLIRVGILDLFRTPGQLTAVVHSSGRPIWRMKTESEIAQAQQIGNGMLLLQSFTSGALMSGENDLVDAKTGRILWHNIGIIQYADQKFIVSQDAASLYQRYSLDPTYAVFNLRTLKVRLVNLHYAARKGCEFSASSENKFHFSTVRLNGQFIALRFIDACGQYLKTYFWKA